MPKSTSGFFYQSPGKAILFSGFIAGVLDMSGALLVYSVIMQKTTAIRIMQGIASGVFGKDAYVGGTAMALYGLAFHFIIAYSFATFFFFIFPYITFLQRQKVIGGLLYGIFVWIVMNIIVLPLVFSRHLPSINSSAFIGAGILMVMIGLPVSLITHKYYTSNRL
jgi:hypothetical protein